MITQKFFALQLFCLMSGVEMVSVARYIRDNHLDLERKIFVLNNDNQPFEFKRVF